MLGLQLAATLAVLALVQPGWAKLIALLICWTATFGRLSKRELLGWLAVSALFSVMDIMTVRQGQFRFQSPELLGLPVWELFMWGFYVLHALRMLNGALPRGPLWRPTALAFLFASPFITVTDPWFLLGASAAGLGLALAFFHERHDLRYVAYMILLGALVEYTGVWSGQWSYPANPPGGVPLWFMTMWGGIGLFTRRLILPLVHRDEA